MQSYSYACFPNDDGTWYVNEYRTDGQDTTRATIYDELTKQDAIELTELLDKARWRPFWRGAAAPPAHFAPLAG